MTQKKRRRGEKSDEDVNRDEGRQGKLSGAMRGREVLDEILLHEEDGSRDHLMTRDRALKSEISSKEKNGGHRKDEMVTKEFVLICK